MSRPNLRQLSALLACVVMSVFALSEPASAQPADPAPARPEALASSADTISLLSFGPEVIRNAVTGKCVDIPGYDKGTVNGPVNEYTCDTTNADNQLFVFDDLGIGDGYYNIRNVKDGLCLDVPNYGSVDAGTPVSEYYCDYSTNDNQLYWLSQRSDGHYWIVNRASGLCLDVAGVATGGNDARITLYYCSDNDDHHWIL
jgi:hypothetical protein